MKLYYKKHFSESIEIFQEIISKNPGDNIADMFLKRIEKLNSMNVPEDWDGIEVMVSK
jgi:hypothetical protein